MFTKRLCALLLALVLSIGVMLPAQARGVKENYEEVQEAFLGYLAGDPTYTITEIVNWLELCGRYDWAPSLKEYAICLKEVEEGNFQMISGRIAKLRRDAAFSAYLEEMGFNSVTELETYALAREAEANGDFETAINLYYETEVCDSRWRRIDLPDRIDALKYDEAMALYNADTYESAGRAAEMFAELAQRLYSDSADMARRAEAKREELRSISIAVNESLNGRNFTMAVTADGAWTVSNDASWLTLSRTSGDGNATITATMEENRTSSSRTAVLTFRCGNKTETVPIEQEKTDWITATRSGSTIRVEANGYWTAVEEASWLTLSQTSGNGSSSITMRMEDNVGSNARMTDVYFTCGTASTSVSITQDKQDVLSASIVGNRISVESNGSWTVTDDASWLTLSCANGTGNAYITMTMEANTTSSARTARITIRCGSETQTLTFRQEKTDSLSVSDSGSGNTRTITLTSNGSWTATESAAWLTLSKTSGTGNASITVTLQPNTTSSARTAPITFTCGNVTKTLSITQAKEDTLNVSTSGSGDTRTITVVSNGNWTATDNASWLTLSKTSGSGNESITATLQPNTGTSRRTATVTFTCGSVTKNINITQEATSSGEPRFSVASEGSYGFALNSNGYYESQNKGRHSTTAACVVTISGTRTAYLDVINYAETGYDYGTIYAVDSRTNKLHELKSSSYNKSTVQTFTITLPDTGTHTLYITFKKDVSANANNDSLQFKVRFSGEASTSSATTSRNFSVTSATKNSNGTVTVRWTDSANNGPYTLHYKQRSSGSWTQDRNSNFRYWNASEVGSVSSKSATLMRLVPGYSYWIVVRDSDGAEAVYEYIAGTAPNFTEYGNTLAITIKRKSNGATADLSKYSASDIAANMATKEYFAYIRLDYSQLARAREYHGVMAIRDPRGQIIADNVATFNFNAGNYYTYWGNYGLEWYFGKVKDSYGSIPTGTYTMYLYLDGKFAASDTFTVGN